MVDDKQAIEEYKQLADKVTQREERDERCRKLALSCKMSMAVVKRGKNDYQIWPLSKCDKNIMYVAEYVGGNENVGTD